MKSLIFVVVLAVGLHGVTAVFHSLKYFYTASTDMSNFPDYVSVGLVDDVQISYCDSIRREIKPSQKWMNKVEDPEYWESETKVCQKNMQTFKTNIQIAKARFNQTEGVHVYQKLIGCEWDDETGVIIGYDQYGYDGEDFIVLDLNQETWTAPTQKAFATKQKWDRDVYEKKYLNEVCVEWLKKYLDYGKNFLKTALPSMYLLQKTFTSPVRCQATGFYPRRAEIFWRKDGEEIHEGVDKGEILPNNDGTFQMSANIDLTSVATEDWTKYECVFQLSGESDIITKLEKKDIRTNEANSTLMIIPIIVVAVVLAVLAVISFILYRKNAKRPPSPVDNQGVQEQMLPTA